MYNYCFICMRHARIKETIWAPIRGEVHLLRYRVPVRWFVYVGCLILLAHDSVDELILVEHTIAILVCPVHHLLELVISEQLERLEEILAGVLTLLAGGHHGQELVKVNGAIAIGIDVVDELTDLL